MRLVRDDVIDFAKYLQADSEAAYVRSAGDWYDDVLELFRDGGRTHGAVLPWAGLRDLMRLRSSEVSIWAGINGHGKSAMLSQIVLHLLAQNQRACIASMEMPPRKTMYRMARQAFGPENFTSERLQKFMAFVDADRLWLYDQQGTVQADRIIALGRYAAAELSVQHLVVDSMMKCGIGPENYDGQKAFVDQLCALAKDTGLHIHLVAHSRKGKTEDDRIGKFDIKGASEITDQADNVFTLWRNKPKERAQARGEHEKSAEPDAELSCDKQRHGDWEGKLSLWYDRKSMQYTCRDMLPEMLEACR